MKNSSGGPVLRKQYFDIGNMKGRKQKCAMLLLLQRLEERRGGYEQDIVSKLQQPCTVAYRKSAPKPFKIGEIEPGPDYYYPQDDMLKVGSAAYTFAKADATKKRP